MPAQRSRIITAQIRLDVHDAGRKEHRAGFDPVVSAACDETLSGARDGGYFSVAQSVCRLNDDAGAPVPWLEAEYALVGGSS